MINLGPSRVNGAPMECFNQNHLAGPGGYPPVETTLMKRKKVIEQILRNLHYGVKMGKNNRQIMDHRELGFHRAQKK